MSNDNASSGSGPERSDSLPAMLGEVAGGIGTGLDNAAEGLEGDAQTAIETAGDVAQAVSNVARAAEAGREVAEALSAGNEARAATAVGNLAGGLLGTAGAALDGVAGMMPEQARGAFTTASEVTRGVAGAARTTGEVVRTIQSVERAIRGRRLTFQTGADLGAEPLRALGARGQRTLSGLYELTIEVEHDGEGGLDDEAIEGLLTHAARFAMSRDTFGAGEVYGVVRRVAMRPMTAPRPTRYELTLVPKLWRLSLVRRSRVYQNKTHLEVVLDVLEQHGLDVGTHVFDHTEERYPTHEYVVQHDETDLAFVMRLLAHNGIHFHFRQDPGTEALVLGDRNAAFEPVEEHEQLTYHPHDFPAEDGEPRLWGLRRVREPRVEHVVVRDYNWRTPHHPLRAEAAADGTTGYGFLDLYGAHFRDDAEGARLARVRAEEELVGGDTLSATTSLRGVHPGSWFELTSHPNPTLNQRYLVVATEERVEDGQTYVCELRLIPFAVTYRPPRTVPWPRVDGITNALVDGTARSTAAPIDDAGRYRVLVPVDEAASAGGSASRWVRRAQPSAGAGYGMHFPLHIGTEVALAHVNGDPDRPVIVGAIPNAATTSPVVGANAPQSRIRSASGVVFEMDDDC